MMPFVYGRPTSIVEASRLLSSSPRARLLGGGTCLVDLMKQGVESPATVIDLSKADELRSIVVQSSGALRIGAAATLSHVARHAAAAEGWPLLHQAIVDGLTPQLRNAATFAGNVMQRPRCIYFREPGFRCNKRVPGSGCAAREGVHYAHAIFGGSDAANCIAVHPSDLCVALTALGSAVHVVSPDGTSSTVPIELLHRLPGNDPTTETSLAHDDMIVAVEVPSQGAQRGAYVKGSEGFALASCASLLDMRDGTVASARIVLGGVAHKPWRARAAEAALVGRRVEAAVVREAANAATEAAHTDAQTSFRLPLIRSVVSLSLKQAMSWGAERRT